MEPKLRKQKLVSVCSVEHTLPSDQLNYINHKTSSGSMKMHSSIRAPINAYNLILIEIYPESKTKEQVHNLPCHRLNFATLCCAENTRAEDVRYDFAQEYPYVESVDFTGHIGSMRLAFELLKNFKLLKEVVLIVTDYNAQFPNGHGDIFNGLPQYKTVESVKIFHDLSILEKSTMDVQNSTWRLDEFLQGCHECFPNLKKFEVNIMGTGANYDKINKFILAHPQLNMRYTVEINNEKVKTRLKLQRPTSRKALPPPEPSPGPIFGRSPATSSTATADNNLAVNNMQLAVIPDLSIVKQEAFDSLSAEMHLNTSSAPEQFGFPHSATSQEYHPNAHSQPYLLVGSSIPDPSMPESSRPFTFRAGRWRYETVTSPSPMKAVCWPQDKEAACSYNQSMQPVAASVHQPKAVQPLSVENVTSSFHASSGRCDDIQSQKRIVNRQSITSDSAYSEEGPDQEQEDEELKLARLHGARNPSPPPAPATCSQNPIINDVVPNTNAENPESTSSNGKSTQEVQQARPRVPTPPRISKLPPENDEVRKLVSYSDGPSTQSSDVSESSREYSIDPRLKKSYSKSSSRSRSSTPPRRKRRYSPEYSRQSSRDAHHHYRRRDEERHNRSRQSPSPVRERSRSKSPSPGYYAKLRKGKDCSNRGRGRGFKSGYKGARGGFNLSGRRPRGRSRGGFRSRPRGRGRGLRPSGYPNYNNDPDYYYHDPHQPDGQNYGTGSGGGGGEAPSHSQEYTMD